MLSFLPRAAYDTRWRAVHDRVFNDRPIDEYPFADATWERCVLAGGLGLAEEDFAGIVELAKSCTDAECAIVDPAWSFPQQAASAVPLIRAEWNHAHDSTPLGHVEVHIVAPSGRWGIVAHPEGVALLAGADISPFFAAAGGSNAVRSRGADDRIRRTRRGLS